jgi:hypothetical protein
MDMNKKWNPVINRTQIPTASGGGFNVPQYKDDGADMRDVFAGMAMQGMLANPKITQALAESDKFGSELFCIASYEIADAMMAERAKRKSDD